MNPYDYAHSLAKAIKSSKEFKDYQEAVQKIKNNKDAQKVLEDFRKKQLEIQSTQMLGKEVSQEKMQELQKMGEVLQFHPSVTEFLNAEYCFSIMFSDIQKILSDTIDIWMPGMEEKK